MAPTVVLLHGFTHTGASWDPVVAALAQRYRAIAPDIRGHGGAGAQRPIDLESCVSDVAALAPERFVLGGYSMGGRLALHFALAHPARVERLVLVGASPGIEDGEERRARRLSDNALADAMESLDIETLAERWAQTPVLVGQSAAVAAAARADRLRSEPFGLAAALRGLGTGELQSLWSRLRELDLPVTLVVGERDTRFRAIAEEMGRRLPDARVLIVPGAGHAAHLERPDTVAGALVAAAGLGPRSRTGG